jgi:hypothetical protein
MLGGRWITIYKMNKANGENAQISWSTDLQKWVIASKNVTIAARNVSEVAFYSLGRFEYARRIAVAWFKILDRYSHDQIIALTNDLAGHTMIGEYIGHPDL